MRTIAIPLAALLSLLMAANSVAASACDLSCWLNAGHSDCPISARPPAPQAVAATSTPARTNATSHHCGSRIAPRTSNASGHVSTAMLTLLSWHPQPPESPGGTRTLSSCNSAECGRPSAFTLPSNAGKPQTVSSHSIEIGFLSSFNPHPASRSGRLASPPSEVSVADYSPLTILRI